VDTYHVLLLGDVNAAPIGGRWGYSNRNPAVQQADLKKDIESLVTMTKGPTPSASSGAVAPAQRSRAAAYVSPPKPLLPIGDKPSTPAQKRSVEQIEGIEEREETQSPKSKAKARASVDPSGLTLEERAKAETILNDFMKYEEKKKIDVYDITFLEDYLTDTINEDDKLQKELENYVKQEHAETYTVQQYNKAKPFLFKRLVENAKP
jgi:hypothetical protein